MKFDVISTAISIAIRSDFDRNSIAIRSEFNHGSTERSGSGGLAIVSSPPKTCSAIIVHSQLLCNPMDRKAENVADTDEERSVSFLFDCGRNSIEVGSSRDPTRLGVRLDYGHNRVRFRSTPMVSRSCMQWALYAHRWCTGLDA